MKKFLFSMALAITFITIGFTSMIFELSSFEVVDMKDDETVNKQTIHTSEVMYNDRIRVELEDSYLYVDIRDDLDQSDELVIQYPAHVEMKIRSDKIQIEEYGYSRHSYHHLRSMLDTFIEGCKEKKIYTNLNGVFSNRIVIHCSPELRSKIRVEYD